MSCHARTPCGRISMTFFSICLIAGAMAPSAHAQGNCPAAVPNDGARDDREIEACLDAGGPVTLAPGYYYVGQTIMLRVGSTVFTGNSADRPVLLATSDLFGPMLEVAPGTNDWEITNLRFGGGVYGRIHRNQCTVDVHRKFGNNLFLIGSGFKVDNVESSGAMCGSAMEVDGSNFEITNSYFGGNGIPEDEPGASARWSDGLTLLRCDNGYVAYNDALDNTDIGIVVGGGNECIIERNTLRNYNKYAFGGLHIGSFPNGGRTHPNSFYRWNETDSGYDKQAFGLIVGFHPWGNEPVDWAGEVVDNASYGAVTTLAVDGINGGVIQRNIWGSAQGSNGFGCNSGLANYTAGHFGAASLQGGYLERVYDCF